jgi:hypothetical protein
MFHPGARGFGLAALLVKVMMVYAIKERGRDSPDEEYLAHVVDGNGAPLHALLDAGFRPIGPVDVKRGDIDAVIDHMIKQGESTVRMEGFVFDPEVIGRLVLALCDLGFRSGKPRHLRCFVRSSRVMPLA